MNTQTTKPEWQLRVIKEQEELNERFNKLMSYMETSAYKALPQTDRELLWEQGRSMNQYNEILLIRIMRFNSN